MWQHPGVSRKWIWATPFTPDVRSARYAYWMAWGTGAIGVLMLAIGSFTGGTVSVVGAMCCLFALIWVWNYRRRTKRESSD